MGSRSVLAVLTSAYIYIELQTIRRPSVFTIPTGAFTIDY